MVAEQLRRREHRLRKTEVPGNASLPKQAHGKTAAAVDNDPRSSGEWSMPPTILSVNRRGVLCTLSA
jgi:hypothetical protein